MSFAEASCCGSLIVRSGRGCWRSLSDAARMLQYRHVGGGHPPAVARMARSHIFLWEGAMPPTAARMARYHILLWEGAMPPTVARMARYHHKRIAFAYR